MGRINSGEDGYATSTATTRKPISSVYLHIDAFCKLLCSVLKSSLVIRNRISLVISFVPVTLCKGHYEKKYFFFGHTTGHASMYFVLYTRVPRVSCARDTSHSCFIAGPLPSNPISARVPPALLLPLHTSSNFLLTFPSQEFPALQCANLHDSHLANTGG